MAARKTAVAPEPEPEESEEPGEGEESAEDEDSRWLDVFGDWENRLQAVEEKMSGTAQGKSKGAGQAGGTVRARGKRPQAPTRPATQGGVGDEEPDEREPDTPPLPLHRWWRRFGS